MQIPVNSAEALGKIERGGESVQWGKLFQVLDGLGIRVVLEVPESVADHINQQHISQAKP